MIGVRSRLLVLVVLAVGTVLGCSGVSTHLRIVAATPVPAATVPPPPSPLDVVLESPDPASPTPSASPAPTPTPKPATPKPTARTTPGRVPVPVAGPTPQTVDGVLIGSQQQVLSNQARAAAGKGALAWNQCLADVAARHAMEMAQAGKIFHGDGVQRDMQCGLGSRQTGENVGETSDGANDQRIFDAFMNSPGHKENILGPYRFIGTAWVLAPNGTGYISVEFG